MDALRRPVAGKGVTFDVYGVPAAQGSKTGFVTKAGKAVVVEGNTPASREKHRNWRTDVKSAAHDAVAAASFQRIDEGAVGVDITFYMPKPKSEKKTTTVRAKYPDIDKLVRNVLDALTGTVFKDDGQVVQLYTTKGYETAEREPGARVVVFPLPLDYL